MFTFIPGINSEVFPFTFDNWVRSGEPFRLSIAMNAHTNYSNNDVAADYEALVSGEKSLEELSAHFYNADKDKWYLGMFAPGSDEWYDARNRYLG